MTVVAVLGGIIGAMIAPSPALATLPSTLMITGIASTTIPAALLMKKVGRKNGFLLASVIALCGTLLAAYAVAQHNFFLFCLAAFFIGSNSAFVQQYRFAAIESVDKSLSSKVVGFVLFAGIISGFFGPEIAKRSKDLFFFPEYSGPFLIIAVLILFSIILLSFLTKTRRVDEEKNTEKRSVMSIISQPHFFVSVVSGATGFSIMTFIMTATPIHLHNESNYTLDNIAFILQSHIIAMFLPSLFTGSLIQKFGVFRILILGLAIFCLTVLFATHAHSLFPYWAALVLLGIGWNFLYISSTVLLSQSHSHSERFKAQGLNDFMVVISQMLASFLAGSILFSAGWVTLNVLTLPLIGIAFLIFLANHKKIRTL